MHPCILTSDCLRSLEEHFRAPDFLQRTGPQYLTIAGSYAINQARRILTVLSNLEQLLSLVNSGVDIKIRLFSKKYPGLGLQTIESAGFLHLFPDCLPINKPRVRFAYELRDNDFLRSFIEEIRLCIDTPRPLHVMESFTLSEEKFYELRQRSQKELATYFKMEGITKALIEEAELDFSERIRIDRKIISEFMKPIKEIVTA